MKSNEINKIKLRSQFIKKLLTWTKQRIKITPPIFDIVDRICASLSEITFNKTLNT